MCSKIVLKKKNTFLSDLTRNFIRSQVFLKVLNRSAKIISQLVGYYFILLFPKKIRGKSPIILKISQIKLVLMISKSYEKFIFYIHNISILASEISNEKIRHTLHISVKQQKKKLN